MPVPESSKSYYNETWTWTTKTADANTPGQVGIDAATWAAATKVNLNSKSTNNRDMTTAFILLFIANNTIRLQQKTDATKYANYLISTQPINNGGWWQFPVTFKDGGGAIPSGNADTTVVLIIPGIEPIVIDQATAGLPGSGQANRPGMSHP